MLTTYVSMKVLKILRHIRMISPRSGGRQGRRQGGGGGGGGLQWVCPYPLTGHKGQLNRGMRVKMTPIRNMELNNLIFKISQGKIPTDLPPPSRHPHFWCSHPPKGMQNPAYGPGWVGYNQLL